MGASQSTLYSRDLMSLQAADNIDVHPYVYFGLQ